MVRLVKASDIAMLSMTLDWKGNLKLAGSCLLGAVIFFVALIVLAVVIVVGLAVVGVPALLVVNGAVVYADDTGWKMAIVGAVCLAGACFFAFARDQKPRLFFDVLARGTFWLLLGIAFAFGAAGFTYLTQAYGKLTVFGVVALFPLTAAFFSYLRTQKEKKHKDDEPAAESDPKE